MKKEIKAHKTDNEMKYQELLKLKKGNTQIQQMIDNEVKIVESLQNMVSGNQEILDAQ